MCTSISPREPSAEEVRRQMRAILSDPLFVRSKRLRDFLEFIVEQRLVGSEVNEQIIGIHVFNKPAGYKTGDETIVRTEAHELRKRLARFYAEHPADEVQIFVPKGSYKPTFTFKSALDPISPSVGEISQAPRAPTPKPSRSNMWFLLAALTAIALFLVWRFWPDHPGAPRNLLRRPLTTYPGSELFSAFSPDSRQVAFAWDGDNEGTFDIYVKFVDDAAQPLRLTRSSNDSVSPVWSPDGHQIAFFRIAAGDAGGIFVVPALGGAERRLAPAHSTTMEVGGRGHYLDWAPEGRSRYLDWSVDGKWLAFVDKASPTKPLRIALTSSDGGNWQYLTLPNSDSIGDSDPRFSPNSHLLSFQRTVSVEVSDLYVVPITGGDPKRITSDNHRTAGHSWTSDGRGLIVSSDRTGTYRLWHVPLSTGSPRPLNIGEDNAMYPSVSRQGTRLAYSEVVLDDNIWQLNIKTPESPVRIISSTLRDMNPQYSPDGHSIAYASDRSGNFEIWVCDRDGQNSRQITTFKGPHTGTPRWSPDGQKLVFDSRPGGNADIYVVSLREGPAKRLTTDPAEDVVPSWSHDGRKIYFASNRSGSFEVWQIAVENGRTQKLTTGGGFAALESPDGTSIYYTGDRRSAALWRIPVGITVAPVQVNAWPRHWSQWSIAKRGIYFIRDDDLEQPTRAALSLLPFDADHTIDMLHLSKPAKDYTLGLSISEDEQSVVYSQVDRRTANIILIDNYR
jgi:Tol biopolymer transport system component